MLRHSGCKMCTRRYMGDGIMDIRIRIYVKMVNEAEYIDNI